MVFTIIGIAIIGVVASLVFKEVKPAFTVFVSLATCILISLLVLLEVKEIFDKIKDYISSLSLSTSLLSVALKIVGIGYLIEFASDIAEESGLASISHKILFAGKIIIASLCLPYVFDLFDMVLKLI